MIYYRPVRELLVDSMKELRQFEFPFSFYEFLKDKFPNTLIKLTTYCGADKRINWDYTLSVCIYDPENNRFNHVGYFYDDACTDPLDFFEHRFCTYYSFKNRFYGVLD